MVVAGGPCGHSATLPAVSIDAAIDSLDKAVIVAWHQGFHPAALDAVAPWWREKETWLPLYVALAAWLVWHQRWRGLFVAMAGGATVGLADYLSAGVFKKLIGRVRPCNLEGVKEHLDLLTGCGSGLSFPSAHAANHFALAVFLSVVCFAERRLIKWALVLWAASIAVGQVYVGRHYFSDIFAGAGLGALVGLGGALLFLRLSPKPAAPES